jgi:sugar phosphate permease
LEKPQNSQLGSARAWFIWFFAALAFGYAFFHRVAPSVMVSDLMAEFAISGAVLGTLSALYFYPYVLMQVPLGALIDRLGVRALLSAALLIGLLGARINWHWFCCWVFKLTCSGREMVPSASFRISSRSCHVLWHD